ncbi:MAG: hypothetical protein AAB699_02200 [Patescibacteria group bacterium]
MQKGLAQIVVVALVLFLLGAGAYFATTRGFVKNGERILKSPEGWDKTRYLSEIEKAISENL